MVERRQGGDRRLRPRLEVSEVEQALETVRFLRPEIVQYVDRYGAASAATFERVIAIWYRGTLEQRAAFVRSCSSEPAHAAAFKIVHAAGTVAAPLILHAVREYYAKHVDVRA